MFQDQFFIKFVNLCIAFNVLIFDFNILCCNAFWCYNNRSENEKENLFSVCRENFPPEEYGCVLRVFKDT